MPAMAGFFGAIGSAIGAAVSALGTGGFLASIGGRLLASVALSALSRALAPKPKEAGVRTTSTMAGGANADGFILGWYATEGQLVCPPMSHGKSGKTPNAYLTYVIEVGAPGQTLDSLILDGEPVTLGTIPHPDGYGLPVQGRFEGCAWVKYYDGTQTAADPMLVAQYGSYERPWTASHVGTGIAYAILTFKFDREVYSGFPKVRFALNGVALYDPRKDSTAGGAGAQRWSNPATWAASVNPMVMIYNILRGITLPGGHVWGGECEAEDLPYARWAAAMDDCDEAHDGAARYRAGFEVLVEDEPYSVIEELLTTCGGQLAEVGGEWVPAVGAPDLPVMFITDDDVIVTEADEYNPFPSPEATYNGVSATFPRPSSVWEPSEIQPIYFPALEAEDGGRRLMASLQINACPYAKQVRRVAREAVRDSRRWRRHSISLPPEASVLQPLDTISWTSARNGYAAKLFEVVEVARDPRGASVAVVLRERDPSDYDFAAETLPTPPSVVPVRPASQSVPGWSVSAATITDGTGTARRPALQFGWTADAAEDATGLRWEVRRGGMSTVALRGTTQDVEAGALVVAAGVLPATGYEARARLIIGKRRTAWSSWIAATTPNIRLGTSDVDAAAVTADVTAAVVALDEWSNEELAASAQRFRGLLQEVAAIRDNVTLLQAQGFTQTDQARQRLALATAQSFASVEQSLTVAVSDIAALSQYAVALAAEVAGKASAGAVTALNTRVTTAEGQISAQSTALTDLTATVGTKASATALTALETRVTSAEGVNTSQSLLLTDLSANVGTVAASGLFAVDAVATPSGAQSRIALKAKATAGEASSARSAAMYLEAVSGGTSRVILNADSVAILNGTALVPPFVVTGGKVYLGSVKVQQLDALSSTIGVLRTATTGERLEIRDNRILVYDASNVVRVRIGEL